MAPFTIDQEPPANPERFKADGGQHGEQAEADEKRTAELDAFGYHVVRFWNHEILQNTEGVLMAILDEIQLARD